MTRTSAERAERALANYLEELGHAQSVERFLRGYGNVRTRCTYAERLVEYIRWLKEIKGIAMTPDQLIEDNLRRIFESKPMDIASKRFHTDLVSEYINVYMVNEGASESTRHIANTAIRNFYSMNDSSLFGHYKIAEQKPNAPPPALPADDIRLVLLSMPVRFRTPLLISWQSGIEINRVLEMDWSFAMDKAPPVKVELQGRKRHKRRYLTFIGNDSVKHIRLISNEGMPVYAAVFGHLRATARRLAGEGMLKVNDIRAWHPHALRHSFETEASHAGVRAEIRDYFLGHISGIQWTYNHRDELHPEDLEREYRKIEPFVSLNPQETVLKEDFEKERQSWLRELIELKRQIAELAASRLPASQSSQG